MTPHPSLSSPIILPAPLHPVRRMTDPSSPCWCGSGKKWKWCHKSRESQTPVHLGALMHDMRVQFATSGYCSHPEAGPSTCSERIIRSHTIQRRGGLAAITENGHVISAKSAFEDIQKNDGEIVPRQISARDASTFPGFCEKHDNEMFKPAETGKRELNDEIAFLLSFRALAYELFSKQAALSCVPIQREADKGKPFEMQVLLQQYVSDYEYGLKLGVEDAIRWKAKYDDAFIKGDYNSVNFYGVEFNDVLPVVACGAFHPEFDFDGRPLQRLGLAHLDFEHVTFNLAVLDGVGSVAILGCTGEANGPAAEFIESYIQLPSVQKADAAIRLAFEHIENVYMKPSWWYGLDPSIRDGSVKRIRTGVGAGGMERQPECLRRTPFTIVTADVVKDVGPMAHGGAGGCT